ncbi:MAG TPA: HIT domain-containing protein [Pyrinomonadaceae bacterium]|nr:HIT domain-containing protein [Pyrinomonadaceae bacterium]
MLWSPWRYDYITGSGEAAKSGCVFCKILQNSASDEENFILARAEFNFVILNIYPYTSGHLMIVPYEHIPLLDDAGEQTTNELMDITKRAQAAISEVYSPDGINLGMNLGKAAGAGVDGHLHMHMLPRWVGDVNFMTAVGQTRTIPESLETTYEKLKGKI